MPIPNDYTDIIEMLAKATREGRVRWRRERSAASFSVSVSGSQFAIWAGTDEQTERPFVSFGIQNPQGKWEDTWFLDEGDTDYELMRELHHGAKRHALGIRQKLESVKEALKTSNVIGEEEPKEGDTSS